MNHDEKNSHSTPTPDPHLEARVIAAVLGEASPFELAELERLIAEQPELAVFKRRMEAVHGLVGHAVRPEQAPMRLSPERRAKLLQSIGGSVAVEPPADPNEALILTFAQARRKRRKIWLWTSSLAASLAVAGLLALREMPRRQSLELAALESKRAEMLPKQRSERSSDVAFAVSQPVEDREPVRVAMPTSEADESNPTVKLEPFVATIDARAVPSAPRGRVDLLNEVNRVGRSNHSLAGNAPIKLEAGKSYGAEVGGPKPSLDLSTSVTGDKDAPIVLSPFNVTAEGEGGYRASDTLSGSRVKTVLRDIGSSVTVLNPTPNGSAPAADDFLSDAKTAASGQANLAFRVAAVTDPAPFGQKPAYKKAHYIGGAAKGGVEKKNFADLNLAGLVPSTGGADGGVGTPSVALPTDSVARHDSPAEIEAKLTKGKVDQAAATPVPPPQDSLRQEKRTADEAVSTFSLHVSDVSFRLAQAALARGETPNPAQIRPEEFYNAFDYGDPAPTSSDQITCRIEQAAHPFAQQRNLVRIAMKVPAVGRGAGQPLHLTVLLDTSGSMERADRVASVRRALEVLSSLLGANDRVTLIGFARQSRLLAENLPGDQSATLVELAQRTPFEGGTNLEEALKLAGELARRHRNPGAQNRIVFLTDGAANLGNADPAQLSTMIETFRQQGIAFDACGVGTDGLDDSILEALTRKGDGRYYVIDRPEDADAGFARQLAGAFRPAAENVKVQVRFNPARVGRYRLIGFEQHRLKEEDFRNDQVDAAELAAEEAAIAVYQVEVLPGGEGELGEVFVRFRDPATSHMIERSWTMLHEPQARTFNRASNTLQLAGTAALLAEKLRGGELAKLIVLDDLAPVVNTLRGAYANNTRVQQLAQMFDQMRRQNGP